MKLPDFDIDFRLFTKPPLLLVAVVATGAFIPMTVGAAIWYKRNAFSEKPRIHIFQDMDNQAKFKAQSDSNVFADGRSMRDYAPGTVAWGRSVVAPDPEMLLDDDLAYRGFAVDPATGEGTVQDDGQGKPVPVYLSGYPDVVEVNEAFLKRGQHKYNVYCYPCHGTDGQGEGPTHRAALRLSLQPGNPSGTSWVPPKNLLEPTYHQGVYNNGHLFNTISEGQGNMAGYSAMISIEDRWAIVAYVRALQKTQVVTTSAIADEEPAGEDEGVEAPSAGH